MTFFSSSSCLNLYIIFVTMFNSFHSINKVSRLPSFDQTIFDHFPLQYISFDIFPFDIYHFHIFYIFPFDQMMANLSFNIQHFRYLDFRHFVFDIFGFSMFYPFDILTLRCFIFDIFPSIFCSSTF